MRHELTREEGERGCQAAKVRQARHDRKCRLREGKRGRGES